MRATASPPQLLPLHLKDILSQIRGYRFHVRNRSCIFLACVFIFLMQAGLFAEPRDSILGSNAMHFLYDAPGLPPFKKPASSQFQHPIPKLIANAEEKFRNLLSKQSQTLEEAVTEYKRRYERNPPKGFDDWWMFAQQHDVKLVDEYDGLIADLAPFWNLTGETFRRRAFQASMMPSVDVVRIKNGVVARVKVGNPWIETEHGERSRGMHVLIETFQDKLPDMDFPVNTRAEGRVLVSWEDQTYPSNPTQYTPDDFDAFLHEFKPDWQNTGNVWEAWRRTCPPDSPARRLCTSRRGSANQNIKVFLGSDTEMHQAVTFIEEPDVNFDFCEHPWAYNNQGYFFSDWRTIPLLVPVFSPAKAPGFSDIRIPSHYYQGGSARYTYGFVPGKTPTTSDDMEVLWEHKSDTIFWRGTTTGGGSSPGGFTPDYHRHRFLQMTHEIVDINRTITFADPPSSTNYVSTQVSSKSLNREIMDTAFTGTIGTYPGGDDALRAQHRFAESVPLGRHWSHKYLLDLDGMSYSARFMAFLASDSVPLKATVYKEYFSDWLQPWLHYIPVSSNYQEIYNIHAFFSGGTQSTLEAANSTASQLSPHERRPADGDDLLRRIGQAGKQWKHEIGRMVDMEVYVYRLCLEYARLWADDRDSMSFTL